MVVVPVEVSVIAECASLSGEQYPLAAEPRE
jgi:hypothetical protein